MKPDYEESIENEDNIASDELLYMEEMEQARIIEQAALAEIELEMAAYPEPDADVPEEEATEAASRTMLKRELRAQALLRLEVPIIRWSCSFVNWNYQFLSIKLLSFHTAI